MSKDCPGCKKLEKELTEYHHFLGWVLGFLLGVSLTIVVFKIIL